MKSSFAVTMCVLACFGNNRLNERMQSFALNSHMPMEKNSSLLVGIAPFVLDVTTSSEVVKLQPEPEQQDAQDSTPLYPSISLDGQMVAYARLQKISPRRIVSIAIYSRRTGSRVEYDVGPFAGSIAVSSDGRRLAFGATTSSVSNASRLSEGHLHVIDIETGVKSFGPSIPAGWPVVVSWSPDASKLAFGVSGKIWVWEVKTGDMREIADGDAPAWSPNGEWIAYLPGVLNLRTNNREFMPGRWGPRCLVMHPDGSEQHAILDWEKYIKISRVLTSPPVWSPDSRSLLISELKDVNTNLVDVYQVDRETKQTRVAFRNTYRVLGWSK